MSCDTNIPVIFEPKVYLIGKQTIDKSEYLTFIKDEGIDIFYTDATSPAEELIEIAGRLCYDSYTKKRPGGNQTYIKHIIEAQHGSVLEHATYNFIITDLSRYAHSELIRHRTKSFSIRSTRYVNEVNGKYVMPEDIAEDRELQKDFRKVLLASREAYINIYNKTYKKELVKYVNKTRQYTDRLEELDITTLEKYLTVSEKTTIKKYCRGLARTVLPGCLATKVFLTSNARSLRNFFELRASKHADKEIRVLANKMFNKVVTVSPNIFGDYKKVLLEDNTYELVTEHRKV